MRRVAVHFCPAAMNAPGVRGLDGPVEVGVGHDDERVLAAQLELHPLAGAVASSRTRRPTAAEPVKDTARTSGRATSAAPAARTATDAPR